MNAQVNELISKLDAHSRLYEIREGILICDGYAISVVSGRTRSGISIYELNDYLFGS